MRSYLAGISVFLFVFGAMCLGWLVSPPELRKLVEAGRNQPRTDEDQPRLSLLGLGIIFAVVLLAAGFVAGVVFIRRH